MFRLKSKGIYLSDILYSSYVVSNSIDNRIALTNVTITYFKDYIIYGYFDLLYVVSYIHVYTVHKVLFSLMRYNALLQSPRKYRRKSLVWRYKQPL